MLNFDEVVIGGGLSALVYAYTSDGVLIRAHDGGPSTFDFFEPNFDLGIFSYQPVTYELKSNVGVKIVGAPKRDLWERLSFLMSIGGNLPFSDKVNSIRIDQEEKTALVVGIGNSSTKIGYNKLRVFDDKALHGLELDALNDLENAGSLNFSPPVKFKVLDWFDVRSGCRHEYDHLYTGDDFVSEIYFYPSERVDGKHNLKDLVAVSYLTREQLNDIEYSDTYSRFKVHALMKEHGIRGTRNGRDPKNPGKYKHYAIRIESAMRDVYPIEKQKYKDTEGVTFDSRTEEEIILSTAAQPSYTHKIHEELVNI